MNFHDETQWAYEKFAVGQPVPRTEDPKLVRGEGRYTDDINLPNQVWAVMVRSRIAHGMLSAGFISAALGTKLAPNCCVVYLSQSLRFLRPVKIGDTIKAVAYVKGIEHEKRQVTIETDCFNQKGDPVVKGEAVVLLDPVA